MKFVIYILTLVKEKKTEKMDGENDSRSSYLNLDQSIGINALQNISFQRQLRARGLEKKTFLNFVPVLLNQHFILLFLSSEFLYCVIDLKLLFRQLFT